MTPPRSRTRAAPGRLPNTITRAPPSRSPTPNSEDFEMPPSARCARTRCAAAAGSTKRRRSRRMRARRARTKFISGSGYGRLSLKVNLRPEFDQTALQDVRRRQPARTERIVLRQDRARVQQIEQIDRRLNPSALDPEALAETDVELCDAIAEY